MPNLGAITMRLFEQLPVMPRFTVEHVRHRFETTFPTDNAAIAALDSLGIVIEMTGQKKNRYFSYQRYVASLDR
jgi:hypothetical protein